ncbi:TPA: hypothetical protein N0F65_000984 [Lagenidium giganteum]|uniref:ethanolamine kinase n=1 Tax=Lagenidium giganteum TaxID=4803 RepID=A0AAV2Z0B5_9STRA|nr:TPA: hypothetical protein N0F65_000984 [Lagenidium giganteum]
MPGAETWHLLVLATAASLTAASILFFLAARKQFAHSRAPRDSVDTQTSPTALQSQQRRSRSRPHQRQRRRRRSPSPSPGPSSSSSSYSSWSSSSDSDSSDRRISRRRHPQKSKMSQEQPVVYLNNPTACLDYVVGAGDRDEFEDVKNVAMKICDGWAAADPNQITVKIVCGGITNRLYRLIFGDKSVLVRLYGDNTEAFIDRTVENRLFALLSKNGFAPTYYGRFTNGRIEGWMDARPVEPEEMGQSSPVDFLSYVGKELAKMHIMEMPESRTPVLWTKLDQFERLAAEITLDDPVKKAALAKLDLPAWRQKLQWLKSVLPSEKNKHGDTLLAELSSSDEITKQAFAYANEVAFCHNDALSGNILYNDSWDRVQIIDYEYGGYNYRAFDFANHFVEHCGFEMNLSLYPNPDQQFAFFKAYMSLASPELLRSLEANKESKAFFHALYDAVNRFSLASHLFWGFWAIVQSAHSKIDFDFLEYAQLRFSAFELQKSYFFAGADN